MKRNLAIRCDAGRALVALGIGQGVLEKRADAQAGSGGKVQVPRFEVDPTFPKPLPNHWYQGMSIGVGVDAKDHVWIVHRPDTRQRASKPPSEPRPVVLLRRRRRFSSSISRASCSRHWGGADGEGYKWPASNHGITIDYKGNVWIGGNGDGDGMVLKFTQDGKFLMKVGDKGVPMDSNSTEHFGQVAKIFVDKKENEAYISDGYGNKRVVGDRRRHRQVQALLGRLRQQARRHQPRTLQSRGAAGAAVPHPGALCRDVERRLGLRLRPRQRPHPGVHARRQVREGSMGHRKKTLGDGSTWDIAFSNDPQQKFIYLADGHDEKVYDPRSRSRWRSSPASATAARCRASSTPSTASPPIRRATSTRPKPTTAAACSAFCYKGMQTVTKGEDQGTVWPKTKTQ